MGIIFSDDFESADFSNWTSTPTGGTGTATVQGTTVHQGSDAAKFTTTTGVNGDNASASKSITWPTNNFLYIQGWVYFGSDYTNGLANGHIFITADVATQTPWGERAGLTTDWTGSNIAVQLVYRRKSDNTRVFGSASYTLSLTTWNLFALSVDYSGTDPVFKWYVDGSLQETITDSSSGTNTQKPDEVSTGAQILNWDATNKGSIYVDEFVARDTLVTPYSITKSQQYNIAMSYPAAWFYV